MGDFIYQCPVCGRRYADSLMAFHCSIRNKCGGSTMPVKSVQGYQGSTTGASTGHGKPSPGPASGVVPKGLYAVYNTREGKFHYFKVSLMTSGRNYIVQWDGNTWRRLLDANFRTMILAVIYSDIPTAGKAFRDLTNGSIK